MITIDTISPEFGLTLGGTMVRIEGSGFAPGHPSPSVKPPFAAPPPSVRVKFGSVAGELLAQSSTLLVVRSPAVSIETMLASAADPTTGLPSPELDVDIVVENLDTDGAIVESTTSELAWSYRRPQTNEPDSYLSQLMQLVINRLRSWLHPRVWHKPHPDYAFPLSSEAGADVWIFNRAEAPAYAVIGPRMENDPIAQQNALDSEEDDEGFTRSREPKYCLLTFTLVGFAETSAEILAMQDTCLLLFQRWRELAHPSGEGSVDVELVSLPREGSVATNEAGLMSFSLEFLLRGVPLGIAPARWTNDGLVEYSTEIDEPQLDILPTNEPQPEPAQLPVPEPATLAPFPAPNANTPTLIIEP